MEPHLGGARGKTATVRTLVRVTNLDKIILFIFHMALKASSGLIVFKYLKY